MDEECISMNLGELTLGYHSSDASTVGTGSRSHFVSHRQQSASGLNFAEPRKPVEKKARKAIKEVLFKSNVFFDSSVATSGSSSHVLESLNASENNSTAAISCGRCANGGCGGGGGGGGGGGAITAGGRGGRAAAAADLMNCCVRNTVEQAKQMHIKGTDCSRDNPYAALGTQTFRKLLRSTGRRGGRAKGAKPNRKKIRWCKPKTDECDGIKLQLCPHLGEGHTHEKLIEEVTPVLLRAARNLDCQLREICRRLFFMKHNVPQMTAPPLVNFHAILAEITRMLIADFASFPAGLKLPGRRGAQEQ